MERFCGVLIEHFAGRFPTWLTPTQCHVITIREEHADYAAKVADALRAEGVRVEVDDSGNNIMKKIRNHRKLQPAYIVILGDDEMGNETVSLRARNGDQIAGIPLKTFIANLTEEITEKVSQPALVPPSTSDEQ
jgi:threonyl-tRNA synthetase